MNGPTLIPAAVQATTSRKCRRSACQGVNPRADSHWCSDLCERIDSVLGGVPHASGHVAVMGRGAAVVHAWNWLDCRAPKEVS